MVMKAKASHYSFHLILLCYVLLQPASVCSKNHGRLLEANRPHLYWTPCAAHCIELMLEDIGTKIPKVNIALKKAMFINGYMYNNHMGVLNMMRRFTNQRNLFRQGITRFATSFITLSQMHKHRNNLRKMMTSKDWTTSKWSKEAGGKKVKSYVLQESLWNNIIYALKLTSPLVNVLRMVDGEKKQPMGYIYEAMDRAKEAISSSFDNKEDNFKKVFEIIDRRWECQLHRPLHAAGHYLNPEIYYDNPSIDDCSEVMKGFYGCIERLIPDIDTQDKILDELSAYQNATGLFGHEMAIRQRKKQSPGNAANDLVDIINNNRTAQKLPKLSSSPGLGCIALQYAQECKGNCSTNNTMHCQPMEDDFTEVFAPNCGVELPTLGTISGLIVGCHQKYHQPPEAFSDVLVRDHKAVSLLRNKTVGEVGVGIIGRHKHKGPYIWCVLFSSSETNGTFVLQDLGKGIEQKSGCYSGSSLSCSGGNKNSALIPLLLICLGLF